MRTLFGAVALAVYRTRGAGAGLAAGQLDAVLAPIDLGNAKGRVVMRDALDAKVRLVGAVHSPKASPHPYPHRHTDGSMRVRERSHSLVEECSPPNGLGARVSEVWELATGCRDNGQTYTSIIHHVPQSTRACVQLTNNL